MRSPTPSRHDARDARGGFPGGACQPFSLAAPTRNGRERQLPSPSCGSSGYPTTPCERYQTQAGLRPIAIASNRAHAPSILQLQG